MAIEAWNKFIFVFWADDHKLLTVYRVGFKHK